MSILNFIKMLMGKHMSISAFIKLVRDHQRPGMVVAEVGCWDGDSFIEWAPIVQKNKGCCLLVDNFRGNPTAVGPHAECKERRADIASRLEQRARQFTNVRIIEGDSTESAAKIEDHSIDICFLDADHRYSHIRSDIVAWTPKIKPGGILCGHDCESTEYDERYIEQDYVDGKHHGVIKAVKELTKHPVLLGDTCWAVVL